MDRLSSHGRALLLVGLCAGVGCSQARQPAPTGDVAAAPQLSFQVDHGVDLQARVIRLGVLNDETGPAAAIGRPYAAGKRLLAAQINAGDSQLLPAGWRLELVERDHGYNPQRAVQSYREIRDDVLMIAHSLGTPNTMPLQPMLQRDHMLVLAASLSSLVARHRQTIPVGASYAAEAMRALDFVVAEQARSGAPKSALRPAIVYQLDDFGLDSLQGLQQAADRHGVAIAHKEPIRSIQRDFDGVVSGLKHAGATHVWLAGLPNATSAILTAAARQQYRPQWLGHSPSWSDRFFDPATLPAGSLASYHWISGVPYWGEQVPGMARFLEVYQRFGTQLGPPDHYLLVSYMQGLLAIEIIRSALQTGVVTRDGLLAVLGKIRGFDSGGLGQPLALDQFPYVPSTRTRVLKPDLTARRWVTVADWASPQSLSSAQATAVGATASAAAPQAPAPR